MARTLYDFDPQAARNVDPIDGFPEGMQSRDVNDAFREYMAKKARFLTDTNGTRAATNSSDGAGGRLWSLPPTQEVKAEPTGFILAFYPNASSDAPPRLVGNDGVPRFIVHPDGTSIPPGGLTANRIYVVVLRADGRYQLVSSPRGSGSNVPPARGVQTSADIALESTDIGGIVAAQTTLPSDPLAFTLSEAVHDAWPIGAPFTFVVVDAPDVDLTIPDGVTVVGSSTGPTEKTRRLFTAISRPVWGQLIKLDSSTYRLFQGQ